MGETYVLDSFAVLALLGDEPGGRKRPHNLTIGLGGMQ